MAAYAALVSLLNNIDQMMNHPRLSTSLDNEQIQPLVEKAGFMLEFIEGYKYGGGSKEAGDVERQIASAAHAAEDVIESHIVDQIHDGFSLRISYLLAFLLKCIGCGIDGKTALDLKQIIKDMDAVLEKATKLKEKHGVSKVEQATHSRDAAADALMETDESSTRTRMVGLDDELIYLLDELTGNQSSRLVTSIVGMGGMGKTTLAKNVYQHSYIMQHFVIRAWATVSEQHDAKIILTQLLSSLGKSTSGRVDELGDQLHKTLSGRRYLIVLDDVWSVEAWDSVRRFFPDNGNRSRVALTTRMANVATDCGSSLFRLNLLDKQKSWDLFCEKVLIQQGDWPSPHLEEIGREIVKLCKGLALSIVVIGGLLQKAPRTVEQWEGVVRDIISIGNSKEKQETLDVLSLSYYHLPPHLKPCLLYMGVFKEDSQIRVSNIVKLWVAEGFIKPNGGRVLEDIAEGYLNDLVDRNLIVVCKLRANEKIGWCGIHDLLRDLCIRLGKEQQFFQVISNEEIGNRDRRLVFPGLLRQNELPHARSIILRQYHRKTIKGRLLRVLDAGNFSSAAEIYENVNLRYISFENISGLQQFCKLCSSISLVWNLQTLIIQGSLLSPIVVAPGEIWKMRQLRHVECHEIYLPDPPRSSNLILDRLQTLKVAVNLRLTEEVCKIIPNIKNLHLLYDHSSKRYHDCLIECLCNLGLRLHKYNDSLIECLCNLEHLHELESLNLSISSWLILSSDMDTKLSFPSSLKQLSLRNCKLHWDSLTVIGSLPQLKVLKLERESVTKGVRWSPIEGQFQSLKFLKIDACDLVYWDADSSHFPVLEKLILWNLSCLKEIPLDLGEISTLKLIRVDCCSISAAIAAIKIREDQLETQGIDSLQIQVRIYDTKLKRLKEGLEKERLPLGNVEVDML